jgi:protein gp37
VEGQRFSKFFCANGSVEPPEPEDERVVYRAEHLRRVSAAVRFLSCEPLLRPVTRRP